MRGRAEEPIEMHVHGKRIYCHGLTGSQQSWMIDRLGTHIGIYMDGKQIKVLVKGVKSAKAILEVE